MSACRDTVRRYLLLAIAGGAIIGCSSPGDRVAGGSGSTTTNGFAAVVRDEQGNKVAGALVRVRPGDYCATGAAPTPGSAVREVVDTLTGPDGSVKLGGLVPGEYTIEIQDAAAGEGVVLRGEIAAGPIVDYGVQTTSPLGAICGTVDTTLLDGGRAVIVQVYGLERRALVDTVTGTFVVAALPPQRYALRLAAEDTGFAPVNYDTVILASGDTARIDPFYLWAHQAILSIDVVAAGLGPDDTVYNFPLLLRLNSGNFDFSTTKKKGTDFRAAKDGGVPVPFEIEWWDSAGATAAIWILADTLYGSPSPLSLRLCWGNRSMKSVSHSNSVFDTAAGFAGVWHLGESGGTMQKDATVHQIDAVPQNMDGSNDVPGIIGRAQRFDGDKDSGSIGIPVASEALSDDSSGAATVSFWAEVTAADSIARWLISPATSRSGVAIDGNGRWVWTGLHSDATADSLSAPARTGVWTLLTAVKRGASRYLYVDGVVVDSSNSVGGAGIGSGIVLGAGADGSGWFTGIVDELRLYHTAVSPAWIRLRYETEREDQRVVSIEPVR